MSRGAAPAVTAERRVPRRQGPAVMDRDCGCVHRAVTEASCRVATAEDARTAYAQPYRTGPGCHGGYL